MAGDDHQHSHSHSHSHGHSHGDGHGHVCGGGPPSLSMLLMNLLAVIVVSGGAEVISMTVAAPIDRFRVLTQTAARPSSQWYSLYPLYMWWKGNGCLVLRMLIVVVLRFVLTPLTQAILSQSSSPPHIKRINVMVISAMTCVILVYPLDVIATTLMLDVRDAIDGISGAFFALFDENHIFALFRGLSPALLLTLFSVTTFQVLMTSFQRSLQAYPQEHRLALSLMAPIMAVTMSNAFVYPIATLLRVWQAGECEGWFACTAGLWYGEVGAGFYSGVLYDIGHSAFHQAVKLISFIFLRTLVAQLLTKGRPEPSLPFTV